MSRSLRYLTIMLCLIITFTFINPVSAEKPVIKNVIYMISDGCGMAPFFLSDAVKPDDGMYIKEYLCGAITTYSGNSKITDSAASGTALSSGYKTNNGMLGTTPDNKPHANILEACQEIGKKTGLVVTYEWSNATPAAFSAHSVSRNNTAEISEQIANGGIDVVFGNTLEEYENYEWFEDKYLESLGYKIIYKKEQLSEVSKGDRLWSKLPKSYYDLEKSSGAPSLSELTSAAITALTSEKGFFLMVEGSAIDGAGHNSDAVNMTGEYIAFDEACKTAIEFAKGRNDTAVIITSDHDTGGMTFPKNKITNGIINNVRSGITPGDIVWQGNGNHTGRDVGLFLYIPEGTEFPDGIDKDKKADVLKAFSENHAECTINRINNTDLAKYISNLIGADLNKTSEKLFVDVTDKGKYDPETKTQTFINENGFEIKIKSNSSKANVENEEIDLGGRVSLYLGEKFYVPMELYKYKNISFSDISDTDWFYSDVNFAVKNNLFSGISKEKFAPQKPLTRAMLVTVLHRMEENPAPKSKSPFKDVLKGSYYEDAVSWAWENKIVSGTSKEKFSPNENITREQFVSVLYRYAAYKNTDTSKPHNSNISGFKDFSSISDYAIPAMQYAFEKGIIKGKTDKTLNPRDSVTRAEAAAMIRRFLES